jgi:hypothetical protein
MIQQGTGALSRREENGLATGGLSLGITMERSPMMGNWIQEWWDIGRKLLMMEPRDLFTTAYTPGYFGWFPAPATVDVAIDQFCESLHKRPHCSRVFATTLIMTNRWRKMLLKAVDVYLC